MSLKNVFHYNLSRNYTAFTLIPTISFRIQNLGYCNSYSILVTWLFWSNLLELIVNKKKK